MPRVGAPPVVAFLLVLLLLSACARDPCAPPTAKEAFDALRTAETFDDTHIGFAGELSPLVAAFRIVLADPAAPARFHALLEHATPAGRLYGAAGLYFADPPAFDAAVVRLGAVRANVATQRGCIRNEESVASIVRTTEPHRAVLRQGESLPSWTAKHPDAYPCDLAGGCLPLSFVEDDRPAPRGPAR